jgi:hypothetical protein
VFLCLLDVGLRSQDLGAVVDLAGGQQDAGVGALGAVGLRQPEVVALVPDLLAVLLVAEAEVVDLLEGEGVQAVADLLGLLGGLLGHRLGGLLCHDRAGRGGGLHHRLLAGGRLLGGLLGGLCCLLGGALLLAGGQLLGRALGVGLGAALLLGLHLATLAALDHLGLAVRGGNRGGGALGVVGLPLRLERLELLHVGLLVVGHEGGVRAAEGVLLVHRVAGRLLAALDHGLLGVVEERARLCRRHALGNERLELSRLLAVLLQHGFGPVAVHGGAVLVRAGLLDLLVGGHALGRNRRVDFLAEGQQVVRAHDAQVNAHSVPVFAQGVPTKPWIPGFNFFFGLKKIGRPTGGSKLNRQTATVTKKGACFSWFDFWHPVSPPLERRHVDLCLLVRKYVALVRNRRATRGDGACANGCADDCRGHEASLHEVRRLLAVVNDSQDLAGQGRRGAVGGQDDLANRDARLSTAVAARTLELHAPGVADEEIAVAEHLLDAVELGGVMGAQLHLLNGGLERFGPAPLGTDGGFRRGVALVFGGHCLFL